MTKCCCAMLLVWYLTACLVKVGSTSNVQQAIIASGNFTIDNKIVNFAKFDIESQTWTTNTQVVLYSSGYNGVIWNTLVNDTKQPYDVYLVGTFDAVAHSQSMMCSVGQWDGQSIVNVGGLCLKGGLTLKLEAAVLGSGGDMFVGGNFTTAVYDNTGGPANNYFRDVDYVARYDGLTGFWLPLEGGVLNSSYSTTPRVTSLAWNAEDGVLYIGGAFTGIDNTSISTGLAMWTLEEGLQGLPTGGVANINGEEFNCIVSALAYEPKSKSLFVSGTFSMINGVYCPSVAVWMTYTNTWMCLYDDAYYLTTVTSMLLSGSKLYLSGWASTASTWPGTMWTSYYAIARLDVAGFIAEHTVERVQEQDDSERRSGRHPSSTSRRINSDDGDDGVIGGPGLNLEFHKRRAEVDSRIYRQFGQGPSKVVYDARSQPQRRELLNYLYGNSSRKDSSRGALNYEIGFHFYDPTRHPTARPTSSGESGGSTPQLPWAVQWRWLQNFSGGNGPIMSMSAGMDQFEGCIFLAGAFNNYGPTTTWCDPENSSSGSGAGTATAERKNSRYLRRLLKKSRNNRGVRRRLDTTHDPNVTVIDLSAGHDLAGLITSIRQVYLLDLTSTPPMVAPTVGPASKEKDYAIMILSLIILVSILVGIGVASFGLFSNRFNTGSIIYGKDLGDRAADNLMSGGGISLTMLSSSQGGTLNLDFKDCFERAMRARHIDAFDALVLIDPSEIVIKNNIGEGSFGRVWSGTWRNQNVAVKEFVFAQAAIVGGSLQGNNIIEEIVGEAGVMSHLRHPKILQLYGCTLTMQALWIVSELCIRGSLRSVLVQRVIPLPLIKKLSICMDIADGMEYLHTRTTPIIHRDLKSHNIFITEPSPGQFVAKIGDWGSARAVQMSGVKSMTHGVGTACWLAPEVINNAHFSKQSDVYAYGIVLWEIFTRQEVYEGLSAAQIIAKVAHEELRPNVPRECPWAQVMTACWSRNANERPDFTSVIQTLNRIHSHILSHPRLAHAKSGEWKVQDLVTAGLSPGRELDHGVSSGSSNRSPIGGGGQQQQLSPGSNVNYTTKPLRFPDVGPYSAQTYAGNSLTPPNERSKLLDYAAMRYEFHPSLDVDMHMVSPQLLPQSTDQPQQSHQQTVQQYYQQQQHQQEQQQPPPPVRVPSFRSRPLDYASDPHNYRPPPRFQHYQVPAPQQSPQIRFSPPVTSLPAPVVRLPADPEDENFRGSAGETTSLLPKK